MDLIVKGQSIHSEPNRPPADGKYRRFRAWPAWLRIALTAVLTTLLAWPMGNYFWTLYELTPYNPLTHSDPECASGPTGECLGALTNYTWRWSFNLPEALCAALAAIAIYRLLTRWRGPMAPAETKCRRCCVVLRALSTPCCSACGEPI